MDDTLATPHSLLAEIRLLRHWDWAGAEKGFKRALELEPGNATVHYTYALAYLLPVGRLDEGISEMKRALELAPLSLIINANLGEAFWLRDLVRSGSYDEAIEQCRKTLDLDSDFAPAQNCLGRAYAFKGRYEEAATQLSRCAAAGGFECLRRLAVVYALSGRRTEALELLGEMRELYKKQPAEAYNMWLLYAALGVYHPKILGVPGHPLGIIQELLESTKQVSPPVDDKTTAHLGYAELEALTSINGRTLLPTPWVRLARGPNHCPRRSGR